MPRKKVIGHDLLLLNLRRVRTPSPNKLQFTNLQWERQKVSRLLRSRGCINFSPRSDCLMIRDIKRYQRATSSALHAYVSTVRKPDYSIVSKRLNKYSLHEWLARKNPFSPKRTWHSIFFKQNHIWTNQKCSGTISFGLMRPSWYSHHVYSVMFGEIQTHRVTTKTS